MIKSKIIGSKSISLSYFSKKKRFKIIECLNLIPQQM